MVNPLNAIFYILVIKDKEATGFVLQRGPVRDTKAEQPSGMLRGESYCILASWTAET